MDFGLGQPGGRQALRRGRIHGRGLPRAEIARRVGSYRPRTRQDPLFSGLLAA